MDTRVRRTGVTVLSAIDDESDVSIRVLGGGQWICRLCRFAELGHTHSCDTPLSGAAETLAHLREHEEAGDRVPRRLVNLLRRAAA